MTPFTSRDSRGRLLAAFVAGSRLEVARKVVPAPSDAFPLVVSRSYRQLFERALARVPLHEGWQIVAIPSTARLEECGREPVTVAGAKGKAA